MIMKPPTGILEAGHPMSYGLVGYWPMLEAGGNIINDLSGNGHYGILSGATWSVGRFGSCLYFDGNGNVSINNSAQLKCYNAQTVSVWFKFNSDLSGWCHLVSNWRSWPYVSWALNANKSGSSVTYYYDVRLDSTYYGINSGVTTIYSSGWHNWVCTYDGSYLRMYIDGISFGSPVSATGIFYQDVGILKLGSNSKDGDWYKGWLDNVLIYNQALSPSEIFELYTNNISRYEECM